MFSRASLIVSNCSVSNNNLLLSNAISSPKKSASSTSTPLAKPPNTPPKFTKSSKPKAPTMKKKLEGPTTSFRPPSCARRQLHSANPKLNQRIILCQEPNSQLQSPLPLSAPHPGEPCVN